MQAITQLTAQNIHFLVQTLSASQLGQAELDNIADRIDASTLPQHKLDELAAILAQHSPMHLAVLDALNPDGGIRDQAAFDRMLELAGQEQGR